jgi:hypothetical protein
MTSRELHFFPQAFPWYDFGNISLVLQMLSLKQCRWRLYGSPIYNATCPPNINTILKLYDLTTQVLQRAQVSHHFLFLFSHYTSYTPSACFKPVRFNTPCQFTLFPNLHSLLFGLTPFGWLHYIMLPLTSDGNIIFHLRLFDLCPLFRNTTRA